MLINKIARYTALLIFVLTIQGCYTNVVLPKHTIKKTKVEENRIFNFTYTVIDTFYNNWFPDEGYYYTYSPRSAKRIKEDKIDLFLNMLYAKGYNIEAAWYIPARYDCRHAQWMITDGGSGDVLGPMFIILLSDVDDSVIQYDFYALQYKPVIECPFNVEEYWVE